MRRAGIALLTIVLVLALALAVAIAFGGPPTPHSLQPVVDEFATVDFSALPPVQRFQARDGAQLAYREYRAAHARGSVVLIHGSSSRSNNMHPMAQSFVEAGYTVYALDVRGHGESGTRGNIAYIGQLEDDLEDFMTKVKPEGVTTLAGFSAGGGFALRFAAEPRRILFDNYLLLSPFLSQKASTYRPASGGWVSIGLPRIIAIALLNRVGITAFNGMPVTIFALSPAGAKTLTPSYSYALSMNFRPHANYKGDIRAATQPMALIAGSADDEFFADRFAGELSIAMPAVPVTVVPGVGHIELTLSPVAIEAAVAAVGRLDSISRRTVHPLQTGAKEERIRCNGSLVTDS